MEQQYLYEQNVAIVLKAMGKLRITKNRDDLYQVGCLALWQACTTFDCSKGVFEMYAYSLVRFALIAEMKKISRHDESITLMEDHKMELLANTLAPKVVTIFLMDELTAEEHRLVQKIFIEGWRNEDVAKAEGKTIEAIKKRRQRLLKKLRALYQG